MNVFFSSWTLATKTRTKWRIYRYINTDGRPHHLWQFFGYILQRETTNRLPPRFLRAGSTGAASGLICFTGAGSCNLSSFCSISTRMLSPTAPSEDSWKLSTRAARLHLAATRRAAFRRKSYVIQQHMQFTWLQHILYIFIIHHIHNPFLITSLYTALKLMYKRNINTTHTYTGHRIKNNP